MTATTYNMAEKTTHQTLSGFFSALNVDQNAASLERLDGVRILVNGWRLSERLQPKTNRRNF
jgi:hypothetical protein